MKRTPLRSLRNGVLRYGRTAEEYLRSLRHRRDYAADTAGLSRKVARLEPLVCVKG